jgi:hypothetical protein
VVAASVRRRIAAGRLFSQPMRAEAMSEADHEQQLVARVGFYERLLRDVLDMLEGAVETMAAEGLGPEAAQLRAAIVQLESVWTRMAQAQAQVLVAQQPQVPEQERALDQAEEALFAELRATEQRTTRLLHALPLEQETDVLARWEELLEHMVQVRIRLQQVRERRR